MSVSRANLIGGPAKVTWNGGTFHSREDIVARWARSKAPVMTSLFGKIDDAETDRVITVPVRLYGAWENLSILFPSALVAPAYVGARIYGTSDLPLVLHGANGDRLTLHNAQITQMANLFLGVSASMFAADVVFTALIKNNANPEDANAYFTYDSSALSSDTGFAKTNFKQQRYSAAWGAITGFTAFQAKDGWNIRWNLGLTPERVDGVGTVDFIYEGLEGMAAAIPIEPTQAQIHAASRVQGTALGRLVSETGADLVITGSGVSVTLKNAGIVEQAMAFGTRPLRNDELVWQTSVGFTTGAAHARAVIA